MTGQAGPRHEMATALAVKMPSIINVMCCVNIEVLLTKEYEPLRKEREEMDRLV